MSDRPKRGGLRPVSERVALVVALAAMLSSCAGRNQLPGQCPEATGEQQVEHGAPRIRLFWRTETESNAYAFFVYRADTVDGEMVCINRERPLPAAGTTTTPQEYVFYDLDVAEGATYYYKLQQVDLNGSAKWLVGDPAPVAGTCKPLAEHEVAEIRTRGVMFRLEAP